MTSFLPRTRQGWLALAAMAAIVVAAILLRFIDLAGNPGGLFPDEAAEGLDAATLLHQPGFHADFFVWFTDDAGREALFAYVVAGAFGVFGHSVEVLRATAAGFGVAGVLAIRQLGVPLPTLVAPATVAGVALGFGAQQVVGDLLAGFFLFSERQFGIGDLIRLSQPGQTTGVTGTVEELTDRKSVV